MSANINYTIQIRNITELMIALVACTVSSIGGVRAGRDMIAAITELRATADAFEQRAKMSGNSSSERAEMMDFAFKCHWLAREATIMCQRSRELDGGIASACDQCLQRCID